jgi:hypothetical protein
MPQFEELRNLAANDIEPCPPSWPLVYHLLIMHDSPQKSNLGAIVAASGEASVFSYARDSIAPMYFSTIGGGERLRICAGYREKELRTTDAEEAFALIREGIDAGHGIFVAGPEARLCYGYKDPDFVEEREVYGFTNWGPAFHGTYSWDRFSKHVKAFSKAEGFAYIMHQSQPESVDNILYMIGNTVIDWQNQHPATKFGMKQEYYGLTAFKKFIEDVRNPEIRSQVDEAYINCHAIQFQSGGRYWLGQYIKQLAQLLAYDMQKHILEIGELNIMVYAALKRFMEFNIAKGKNETEIQGAVGWLEEAYHADERILEKFVSLSNTL